MDIMKKILLLISFMISFSATSDTLWEKYILSPTSENAAKVFKLEYTKGAIPENYGYWYPHLEILEKKVLEGDREAFLLAYRLREQSDGGLLQDFTTILGRAIRPHTLLFLNVLSKLNPHKESLKSILLMTGGDFVDDIDGKLDEIRKRKRSIEAVKNTEFTNIKKQCVQLFDKYILFLNNTKIELLKQNQDS